MPEFTFGIDESGEPVAFNPAALHTAVAGRTRSGKSVTVYGILSDASEQAWVRIVGIDPTGVLLGPLSEGKPLDFALGTTTEALQGALDLVRRIENEMDRRIAKLMALGVDQIPSSAYCDPRLGAILVVLEEYAGVLAAMTRTQADEIRRVVGRVLREGSKAAIHVLTILQRLEAAVLHERAQYARAIVMAVENADSVRMLLPSAMPEQIEQLLGAAPGRGFIAEAGRPMRFFRADSMTYSQYAATVRASAARKTATFVGNASRSDARQQSD